VSDRRNPLKINYPILEMNHFSRNTRATAGVASVLTAAILVAASSLQTTTTNLGGGVAYAQEEEFTVDTAIDSVSWDPRTKQVTVDFTVICSEPADGSWLVRVEQNRGGKVISGFELGPGELGCDEEGAHLTVTIEAFPDFFRGGPALVSVDAVASTDFESDSELTQEEVRLSPRG
jgi:hypothetical protein